MKRIIGLVLACILVVGTLSGCGSTSSNNEASTTETTSTSAAEETAETTTSEGEVVVKYGMTGSWDKWCFFNNANGGVYGTIIYHQIYDYLYQAEADGSYSPRAADSWEFAEDNMSVTFYLNQEATFHDGEKVTADDWIFTFNVMTDEAVVSGGRSDLAYIAGTDDMGVRLSDEGFGVEKIDDYTIKINFKNPQTETTLFKGASYTTAVIPEHLLKDVAMEDILTCDYWLAPIGSGPFKYESEVYGSSLTLTVNEDYHMGTPDFDKMVFQVVEQSNLVSAIMAGELDLSYTAPSTDDALAVANEESVNVIQSDVASVQYQLCIDNTIVTDERVRQAMRLAASRELIVEQLLGGYGEVTDTILRTDASTYAELETTKQDVEAAKALVQEAGWDSSITLRLGCVSGSISEKIATILANDFNAIGISTEIVVLDGASFWSAIVGNSDERQVDLCVIQLSAYANLFQNVRYYHQSTAQNWNNQVDPVYMEMLEEFKYSSDEAYVKEKAAEFQKYVQEHCPWFPICNAYTFYVTSNNVDFNGHLPYEGSNDPTWDWIVKSK